MQGVIAPVPRQGLRSSGVDLAPLFDEAAETEFQTSLGHLEDTLLAGG